MRGVCFYISGHGFGHASRQIEIINALGRRAPGLRILIRSAAARWLFERTLLVPATLTPGACDTGAVQIDSLRLDEDATIRAAAGFHADLPARAGTEAALLAAHDIGLVVADAPPLACAAAARAGIPSVVVANFTWDWIYACYAPHPLLPALLETIHSAYARAAGAWRLPMHGGFAGIHPVRDVPFVARHATVPPPAVRERLRLPRARPLVLVSFGGFGLDALPLDRLDCLREFDVVMTYEAGAPGVAAWPPGVHAMPAASLQASGLRYEDLVAAVDVVLTKPGYGIVSECIANRTGMLYAPRGRFAEYEVLTAEMPRYLRCARIEHDALFGGRWLDGLRQVAAAPPPPAAPATDGAEQIAGLILHRLGGAEAG